MKSRLRIASVVGILGVIAGAFGAHVLKSRLMESGMLPTWNTAVLYHMLHAVALLAIGLYEPQASDSAKWLKWSCLLWVVGIVLFSGSLYGLATVGPRFLGYITPIGGICFIAGWACLFGVAAQKAK